MTKGQALNSWFNQFMTVYPTTAVPDDVIFPYGTYDLVLDSWDGGEVSTTVKLWFYTESEAVPNAKANELSAEIGLGGKILPCDGGYIWIKRGHPFCQSLQDESEDFIKMRYINISLEYLTEN